jgi:diguanylate cyclase (GGDEF)-like protein/PAS domain S-box-containing protein
LDTLDLIVAGTCGVFAHAMLRLWRNRHAPGAIPSLLLFAAITAYALAVAHPRPSLLAVQIGYVAITLVTPLLFTAAIEYTGLAVPGWKGLRWLLVPGVTLLAVGNLATDQQALLTAAASEADLLMRSNLIQQAQQSLLFATDRISYGFGLLTIVAALWTVSIAPAQRRGMAALAIMPALSVVAGVAHDVAGFTVAGAAPTPFALVLGALLATSVLYRSNVFDLRPIARALLVDSVMDGMLVVDARKRILDCNRTAERIIGRSRKDIIGSAAQGLLPREFSAMLQSPVHLRSELAVRAATEPSWFEVDVTPLALRGRPAGHVLVARDISERRLAQEALEVSRQALEAANARLVEQSVTDPLTGLKNRRFLFQRLNEEMNRHHRTASVLGLLVVDIDHFKTVNDTHGHPVGDEALIQVAAALESLVRDCDVVARLGGEEFGVLAVNTEAVGLITLAERIRQAICRVPVARDTFRPMVLTVSIGVAFAGPATRTADGLFAEADRHLYAAKHQGRNRVVAARLPLEASSAGR